jgi:hypothetical protein
MQMVCKTTPITVTVTGNVKCDDVGEIIAMKNYCDIKSSI